MPASADATVIIAGAGIGGLVLALALKKHCGLAASEIEVYEQAPGFGDNVGGAMGLYANGLRVVRDISPELLASIRAAGYDYIFRRWLRHDGTEVACAREAELTADPDLQSIGIRRWKLQKTLFDAATAAGIHVRFGMRTDKAECLGDGRVRCTFLDGTVRTAKLVFGADGVKSKCREAVHGPNSALAAEFTGVTCLMGAAKVARPVRGICFPSSRTTKNHGCFYPTGDAEQIFQLYFPAKSADEAWGVLSPEEGRKACSELASTLRGDGWDEAFLAPLEAAEAVIKVGIFAREPFDKWVSADGRVVLLGDAAHPPVPYIGQGAMMAMEDVGVLVRCLRHHCCAGGGGRFDPSDANLAAAAEVYQAMRIPRATKILGSSHTLGKTQQMRADSWWYNLKREWSIWLQVLRYGTLPIMKPGAAYDFDAATAYQLSNKAPPDESESRDAGGSGSLLIAGVVAAAAAGLLLAARRR